MVRVITSSSLQRNLFLNSRRSRNTRPAFLLSNRRLTLSAHLSHTTWSSHPDNPILEDSLPGPQRHQCPTLPWPPAPGSGLQEDVAPSMLTSYSLGCPRISAIPLQATVDILLSLFHLERLWVYIGTLSQFLRYYYLALRMYGPQQTPLRL